MHLMLTAVYVNGDAEQPALTVTDKAHGRTPHFTLIIQRQSIK
jgi:hypothetical protein